MPSPTDSSNPRSQTVDLDVRGAIPPGLSGRLLGIGRDGTLHSVHLNGGRLSYRVRHFDTDEAVLSLVAFGSSILAFGNDSFAYEMDTEMDTVRRVDLAGQGRTIAGYPRHDLATGELHLVALDVRGDQAHVVVSAGALTRRSRPILPPRRIKDVSLSRDHAVFLADGFIGVAPRDGEARTTWIATGAAAPHPVHAHDAGDAVALLALTPSLERWMLHPGSRTMERSVLDETPRRFAHLSANAVEGAPRWLWTTGEDTVARHDLIDSRHAQHSLRPNDPGDFAVVPDAMRPEGTDSGWLIGFVRDRHATTTDLFVMDAADIGAPAVATARLDRSIPVGLRVTWIRSTQD